MFRTNGQFLCGILVGAGVVTLLFSGANLVAREEATTAPQTAAGAASTSKVVLENDRVRVKDVTFPPGGDPAGMHTHKLPHVGIILTPGSLVFSEPGKASETVKFDLGSVGFREANVTHGVTNPGKQPMRVIEVELK
jgi:quercetin dioxygenase-like cupin family protein